MNSIFIAGASSGIAQSIINDYVSQQPEVTIIAASRSAQPDHLYQHDHLYWHTIDYSDTAIAATAESLKAFKGSISRVFICHGQLHNDHIQPEKRIENFDPASQLEIFNSNTITPMLWLKHLLPVVKHSDDCAIAIFSARIGSISDNSLGGWYSYRASKAALNMLIKTSAIEYARRAKSVRLIAFHPGTTDTPLSKPFQRNVKPEKLFTADFVASQLINLLASAKHQQQLQFIDYNGNTIEW